MDPVAAGMRDVVHRLLARLFPDPCRMLDAGCGIGTDTAHLARCGHEVVAIDQSLGMVNAAQGRAPQASVHHLGIQGLHELPGLFDGALMNFGVINCLPPHRVAAAMAAKLRPGARLVLVTMPRVHPSWMAYRLLQGHPREALRRMRSRVLVPVEGIPVETHYRSPTELRRIFSPWFEWEEQHALGLLLPPMQRAVPPTILSAVEQVEKRIRQLPVLRQMGDHVAVVLRRRALSTPTVTAGPLRRRWWTRSAQQDGHVRRLRTLILEVTTGCQSLCTGCSYRGRAGGEALTVARCVQLANEARARGGEEVLLTGGEPLLRPDFAELLEGVAGSGLSVIVLTNGLLLARHAKHIAEHAHAVVLSLDGFDEDSYVEVRGVRGFQAIARGVQALRAQSSTVPITARVTVSNHNAGQLSRIAAAAQEMGLTGISFLAADTDNPQAFGRTGTDTVAVSSPDPDRLRRELADLRQRFGAFVVDSPSALQRVSEKFAADHGHRQHRPPRCDAPWTSTVVSADLSMKPCFFLPAAGNAAQGLDAGLAEMAPVLAQMDVHTNPTCARCVCWARLT